MTAKAHLGRTETTISGGEPLDHMATPLLFGVPADIRNYPGPSLSVPDNAHLDSDGYGITPKGWATSDC